MDALPRFIPGPIIGAGKLGSGRPGIGDSPATGFRGAEFRGTNCAEQGPVEHRGYRGKARLTEVAYHIGVALGRLLLQATKQDSLLSAWRRIRRNGKNSTADETVAAIEHFEHDVLLNIKRIQSAVRRGKFVFDPQKGVLKKKSGGSIRGIVMASVRNRIVERALLDCMQTHVKFVRSVITHPTSVGGVPYRSVPHGLKIIRDEMDSGAEFFVRSDISGFFDNIPRQAVLEILAKQIDDAEFLELIDAATSVTLENEAALGEDRKAFPTATDGVAQGSPLSALFGNLLLYEFDRRFNERGVSCVRFIDDFLILSKSEKKARKAFESAKQMLEELGLECHDPFFANSNQDKTETGHVNHGFVFLGYDIRPGIMQPSKKARKNLINLLTNAVADGKNAILDVSAEQDSFARPGRYVQTFSKVDRTTRGWGNSFAYGNSPATTSDLDKKINGLVTEFVRWYRKHSRHFDWKEKRRAFGVCLLSDIEPKSLEDLPFVIESKSGFRMSKSTITVSTDGSVIQSKRNRKKGPGGWAYVIHEHEEESSGQELQTTNNRMELMAVVSALRRIKPGGSVLIRTDSQYVSKTVNDQNVIKKNFQLWREFQELSETRKVKIIWVKSHSGDPHNERADELANQAAHAAQESSSQAAC